MSEPKRGIQPAGSFDASTYAFSQGIAVGATVWISGQVSAAEGLAAQAAEALDAVDAVIREAGGQGLCDLVKLNVFTKDESVWRFVQPRIEAAMAPPYPASTMVTIVGLAAPQYLVEIEGIAVLGCGTPRT